MYVEPPIRSACPKPLSSSQPVAGALIGLVVAKVWPSSTSITLSEVSPGIDTLGPVGARRTRCKRGQCRQHANE